MTVTKPTIAIVGAGPGGLLLARLLYLSSIPFTLYEGEPHRYSREQGGSLDLHEESGQLALIGAQLIDEFRKIARSEGENMRIADKTGHLHWEEVDTEGHNRPEADRIQLRGILLDSLPENAISWGSKVRSITSAGGEKYEIHIETASAPKTQTFDLVVGADGAWSKVRPLLSSTKPQYSTISCLDCRIRNVDTRFPHVSKMVGQGTYFAFSNYKGLIAQRNGDGSIRTYAMLQVAETWLKDVGVDWTDAEKAKEFLLKEYADWDDSLKDLIRHSDADIAPRVLYQLPTNFAWPSRPGVTLLGDAAHLMTPFAGEGVNLAMLDGLDLSKAIIKGNKGGDLAAAIEEHETVMMERSHEKMEETLRNLELFFQENAPIEFVKAFEEMMAAHGPPPGIPEMPNPQA